MSDVTRLPLALVLLVISLLLVAFELMFQMLYIGPVPVPLGTVIVVVSLPWLIHTTATEILPTPAGAAAPLVVWFAAVLVLAVLIGLHKEFVAVSLDREMAAASRLPVFWLDMALYVLVTVSVVIAVQTIGNILVLALLITPAATARLLTDKLGVMMALAPLIGGASSFVGIYISWSLDWPAGGSIVLVCTACFLIAWLVAPRHGLVARLRPQPVADVDMAA